MKRLKNSFYLYGQSGKRLAGKLSRLFVVVETVLTTLLSFNSIIPALTKQTVHPTTIRFPTLGLGYFSLKISELTLILCAVTLPNSLRIIVGSNSVETGHSNSHIILL